MQLPDQQVHEIFLDKQKQRNQTQGDDQQPSGEQEAGKEADSERNQKRLRGDAYHLLGLSDSQ